MLADDGAAANGVQTELPVAALLPDLLAIIGVFELVVERFVDRIGNHQSGA